MIIADCRGVQDDEQLVLQGWVRRFVGDRGRAEEAGDIYTGAGLDFLMKPLRPEDLGEACRGCAAGGTGCQFIVYTRKKPPGDPDG